MRVLFVYRAPEHSPNHVDSDAAVLDAVRLGLGQAGVFAGSEPVTAGDSAVTEQASADVVTCSERALPADLEGFDLILHMGRRLSTLVRLERLRHPLVVNSPQGVRHVAQSRELTLMLLQSAGISVPQWWAFDPEADEMFLTEPDLQSLLPGWVKAMRTEGTRPEDVAYVASPLEADSRILELAAQQVPDIVVTRHLEGDLIKCYCVLAPQPSQAPFFRWFYPQESGYSKFGQAEQYNSPLAHVPFAEARLSQLALSIARTLELQVFGFDAIVQPPLSPGQEPVISVIDVNDWPSFSSCRQEAARAIVRFATVAVAQPANP